MLFSAGSPTLALSPSVLNSLILERRRVMQIFVTVWQDRPNKDQARDHFNSISPLPPPYTSLTSPSALVASLTSSPLIFPSSCSAPLISSICDCLAPASPCATRHAAQGVKNPSFESGYGPEDFGPYWRVTDTEIDWQIYSTNERVHRANWGM